MNWRVYLMLLRPWHSAQMVGLLLAMFFVLRLLALGLLGGTEGNALAWWGFIMPVILGFVLTDAVRAPMHHPFGVFLPDLRRQLARWHIGTIGSLTLLCTAMVWKYDPALPPFAVAGVVAVLNLFLLPGVTRVRGTGIRVFGLLAIMIFAGAIFFPNELRPYVLAYPWHIGLGTWALAGLFYVRVFSRRAGRRYAQMPYLPFIASSIPSSKKVERREGLSLPKVKNPSPWTTTPANGSMWAWLGVLRYERTGRNLMGSFMPLLRFCVLGGLAAILFASDDSGKFGRRLYAFVWFDQKPDYLFLWIVFLNANWTTGFLRPSFVYPISRTQQAKGYYLNSVVGLIIKFAAIGTTCVLAAWFVANRHDWPRSLQGVADFLQLLAWLFALNFLVQASIVKHTIRQNAKAQSILGLFPLVFAPIFGVYATKHISVHFSAIGFAWLVVAITTSQYAYYAAVRRFYRKQDLTTLIA